MIYFCCSFKKLRSGKKKSCRIDLRPGFHSLTNTFPMICMNAEREREKTILSHNEQNRSSIFRMKLCRLMLC